MARTGLMLLLLAASPIAFGQEVAYVTDILRLGIHRVQDTSDRPFQNLISGTELTILERVPNYARVRTSDGQEGWVKSAYLVDEKPAQLRVAEVEAELEKLRAELADAMAAKSMALTEADRANKQMAESQNSDDAIRDTLGRLQDENEDFESRLEQYRGAIPWTWVAIALGVALVAGFLSGIWWLDNSIRRRFGGFRPY